MDEELTALDTAIEFVDKTVRKTSIGEDKSVPFHEVIKGAPAIEAAKVSVSLAYTLGTLYYTMLRAHGESAKDHSITEELQRIKTRFVQVKKKEAELLHTAKTATAQTRPAARARGTQR